MSNGPVEHCKTAIIGAGFGGLCMAMTLKRAGIKDFLIYEKSAGLGGTWRANTYPGAACDIPSFLYSYSFEQKSDWSRNYSDQEEILAYLQGCADKYRLHAHIRFDTEIASARFDRAHGVWHLETKQGDEIIVNILITATGQLDRPHIPPLPGLERFSGASFHSATWDHTHDLSGKNVAVVGNAASAIQFIPHVATKATRVTIFQRSPNWIMRKRLRNIGALERFLFTYLPLATRLRRLLIYLKVEARFPAFANDGFVNRLFSRFLWWRMGWRIRDKRLRKILHPNYPPGCKRILLSNDYLNSLHRDNVEVVTSPIERIGDKEVQSADGRTYSVDTLIFATGFKANLFLSPMTITGLEPHSLRERWKDGAEAYLGITVSGFPNLFMLYGPNTNLGHNSVVFMLESQARYILQCIQRLRDGKTNSMDVRPEVMADYNDRLQSKAVNTIWGSGCTSWYKTDAGKVVNNWVESTISYRRKTAKVRWSDYCLEERPGPPAA